MDAEEAFSIDWAAVYRPVRHSHDKAAPGSADARDYWDAKAPGFARKLQRSDYLFQLMERMALAPGESVFDMGCGSGTLAVPLAKQGHRIAAVDFSSEMLRQLQAFAEAAGVEDRITTYQRSWQDSWEGLPQMDVAVASRSFITEDLADGIAKLEGQARSRVFLSCGAGDLPYRDERILGAMGRGGEVAMAPRELMVIVNYLWSLGRLPKVSYIEYPGIWHRPTREGLAGAIRESHAPRSSEEGRLLDEFLDKHMVFDREKNRWTLDYPRQDRWALIEWSVKRQ